MSVSDRIKELAKSYLEDTISNRRYLHANPELSFEEHNTASFIAERLSQYGIEFQAGVAGTGIVGLIKGRNPEKKTIALRGDMDALPIKEKNEVDYASKNTGVMHACGHDVHSSSLLATARILNEIKEEFEGTIKLIFQPGEELLPGGATLMIKEGALKNPDASGMFGQHVFPELEAGKVGFRPGMYMASTDELYLKVKGKGGHGALPFKLVDPVLMSAHIIIALQQVVSRKSNPTTPSVLSFGDIHGHGATNVIPDEVNIAGTFRTLNEEWRAEAHQLIQQIAEQTAISMGGTCEVEIRKGYPFLENDPKLTNRAKKWAQDYLGSKNVVDLEIRMTAEDFAWYSHELPVCFYRIGTANFATGVGTSSVHTPTFDIDEKALETSTGLMAYLAIQELAAT